MSNSKFDEIVREALEDSANEIDFSTDLFPGIKAKIYSPGGGKTSRTRFQFTCLTAGKKILLSAGAIIILFSACAMFSKDFRVRAADLINVVKTIFVVEGTIDNYQVVQKPVEDQLFTPSVSQTNHFSDREISQKVGYQISFPESLYGDFILDYKAIGVVLETQMNYNQSRELQSSMSKAVTDDQELARLNEEYGAKRNTFGTYRNYQGITVFINIHRSSKSVPAQGKNRVSIGNAWGQWHEFLLPEYPLIQENGVGGSDISQKPVNVRITHGLSWEWKGLSYYLCFYKDNELSLKDSIKVAESFMAGRK